MTTMNSTIMQLGIQERKFIEQMIDQRVKIVLDTLQSSIDYIDHTLESHDKQLGALRSSLKNYVEKKDTLRLWGKKK